MKLILSLLLSASVLTALAQDFPTSLKDAFKNDFRIGAAINQAQFDGDSPREAEIITQQFNTISPEN
ncbi:MAG TPA: 1,4-beta-xylanase, partial [Verrucomicrobiae bacterium]|nr:1,4-beta-xylanase [Verrucomicrobiae bacterium]